MSPEQMRADNAVGECHRIGMLTAEEAEKSRNFLLTSVENAKRLTDRIVDRIELVTKRRTGRVRQF